MDNNSQSDSNSDQVGLFDVSKTLVSQVVVKPPLPEVEEWSEQESLDKEKEVAWDYIYQDIH